jgi:hypothetical protein
MVISRDLILLLKMMLAGVVVAARRLKIISEGELIEMLVVLR